MGTTVESVVMFRDNRGSESSGTLIHLTPHVAVFEVYGPRPFVTPRELLKGVRILRSGKPVYMGTVEVSGIAPTGQTAIVSANLVDPWDKHAHNVDVAPCPSTHERFDAEARAFIAHWEERGRRLPAYQLAVGHVREFLLGMSRWVASLDIEIDDEDPAEAQAVRDMARAIDAVVYPKLKEVFDAFEDAASRVGPQDMPNHAAWARRELHPLMLCSPFIHRTFTKPLGYPGDYEMVNMIMRDPFEGPNVYAQLMNAMILRSGGAQAHRNRIDRLTKCLEQEAARAAKLGRPLRVLNIGCGPAGEIQRFIRTSALSEVCQFQLMDFNQETLDHARSQIAQAAREAGRTAQVAFIHKSITDLLKDASRGGLGRNGKGNGNGNGRNGNGNGNGSGNGSAPPELTADFVYCAGLFDYLSDKVSARVLQLLNRWVTPGGLVLATNVHPRNDVRYFLDHLLDWTLIYRDEGQMLSLAPDGGVYATVDTDPTGLNVFLEICKPALASEGNGNGNGSGSGNSTDHHGEDPLLRRNCQPHDS